MTIVHHAKSYGRFIQIKSNLRRKKLHRTSAPIFLDAVLPRMTMSDPQFSLEEDGSPSIVNYFFLKNTPIHFHISSTSVIRGVK